MSDWLPFPHMIRALFHLFRGRGGQSGHLLRQSVLNTPVQKEGSKKCSSSKIQTAVHYHNCKPANKSKKVNAMAKEQIQQQMLQKLETKMKQLTDAGIDINSEEFDVTSILKL